MEAGSIARTGDPSMAATRVDWSRSTSSIQRGGAGLSPRPTCSSDLAKRRSRSRIVIRPSTTSTVVRGGSSIANADRSRSRTATRRRREPTSSSTTSSTQQSSPRSRRRQSRAGAPRRTCRARPAAARCAPSEAGRLPPTSVRSEPGVESARPPRRRDRSVGGCPMCPRSLLPAERWSSVSRADVAQLVDGGRGDQSRRVRESRSAAQRARRTACLTALVEERHDRVRQAAVGPSNPPKRRWYSDQLSTRTALPTGPRGATPTIPAMSSRTPR